MLSIRNINKRVPIPVTLINQINKKVSFSTTNINYNTNSDSNANSDFADIPVNKPLKSKDEFTYLNQKNSGHLFEPIAVQAPRSPMRRQMTWIEALGLREKFGGEKRAIEQMGEKLPDNPKLIEKTMSDSYTEVRLAFKKDKWLMDAYVNAYGRLRIGQIFQDLDALAGVISFKHCKPYEPFLVTASVDKVYMLKRLEHIEDIIISGSVTYTGYSSMEVSMKVEIDPSGKASDRETLLTSSFTFVSRNPVTQKAYPVNKLVPTNPQEEEIFKRAQAHYIRKKTAAKEDLSILPPSQDESALIHALYLERDAIRHRQETEAHNAIAARRRDRSIDETITKKPLSSSPADPNINSKLNLQPATHFTPSIVNVSDTVVSSTMIMQPQYRNFHSFMIFGGYLLRQTFELAYACTAQFTYHVPRFVSLDQTSFRAPVPVGCICSMNASVVYTEPVGKKGTLVQVSVNTTVRNIKEGNDTHAGNFVYSFYVSKRIDIFPTTYQEYLEYIAGRRRTTLSRQTHPSFNDVIKSAE